MEKNINYKEKINEIFSKYNLQNENLINALQKIQDILGYLPKDALIETADKFSYSLSKVYGIATFYSQFRLEPIGEHTIQVCQGTACHVKGASDIMKRLEKELNINAGETTTDNKYTLNSVACVGACGLAPVVIIDGETHGRVTQDDIPKLLGKDKKKSSDILSPNDTPQPITTKGRETN